MNFVEWFEEYLIKPINESITDLTEIGESILIAGNPLISPTEPTWQPSSKREAKYHKLHGKSKLYHAERIITRIRRLIKRFTGVME